MANINALPLLLTSVIATLTARGVTASVPPLGWARERDKQLNQGPGGANRVVFLVGEPDGTAGELLSPRKATTNPRALLDFHAVCWVSVWAVDTTDTYNEALQMSATLLLFEQVVDAINRSRDATTGKPLGVAQVRWDKAKWTVENREMYFGRELLARFVHSGQLYERAYDTGTPTGVVHRGPIGPIT